VVPPDDCCELHASNSQLQWVVDAYGLLFAALLLARQLSDRLGRRDFLLAGLSVFGAASIPEASPTHRPADRRPLFMGSAPR